MNKDWQIYAVITAGIVAVVYFVKKTVATGAGGSGAVGNNGVVQTLAAAGTQQVLDQSGNLVVGAFQGVGYAANDLYENIDPDQPVVATGSAANQQAADDYVASMGGYVAPGLPE
jgi:hypothetical protein